MHKPIIFILLPFVWLFAIDSVSASPRQKIDLKKLEKKYADLGSIEADFVQEVYQAVLDKTKTSSGIITISKPKNIRWEIHAPERSILVSNGNKLWYFDPAANAGKGQVITRKASSLTNQPFLGILNGSIPVEKEFKILKIYNSFSKPSPSAPLEKLTNIRLKPLKKRGDLDEIELTINEDYLIKQLILLHLSKNKTKISLQNIKLGSKLPTNLFKFIPPPESEQIEE